MQYEQSANIVLQYNASQVWVGRQFTEVMHPSTNMLEQVVHLPEIPHTGHEGGQVFYLYEWN